MIALSICFGVLAAMLLIRPPAGRVLTRRLGAGQVTGSGASHAGDGSVDGRAAPGAPTGSSGMRISARAWHRIGLGGVWIAVIIGAQLISPGRGVAIALAGGLAIITAIKLITQRSRQRTKLRLKTDVAQACSVLASQVAVGRVPADALRSASVDCPVLAEAEAAQRIGGDVVATWRASATDPGKAGLLDLARAWEVSSSTGAPMARSLEEVAEALNADQALGLVVNGELAAPRATGQMMAVLPLVGIGLGYLIGGDPLGFLLGQPIGWLCLVGGALLACAGVLWIERLANRAADRI